MKYASIKINQLYGMVISKWRLVNLTHLVRTVFCPVIEITVNIHRDYGFAVGEGVGFGGVGR